MLGKDRREINQLGQIKWSYSSDSFNEEMILLKIQKGRVISAQKIMKYELRRKCSENTRVKVIFDRRNKKELFFKYSLIKEKICFSYFWQN